ncbi:hypothetical protein LCGC14_2168810 [marine sediment metagenome]|uniref:Uncharacterized protein n=1 Tax=marine sediment metagenome TaxID=412755 RepID=A0A0F9GLM2_9ZZZZ
MSALIFSIKSFLWTTDPYGDLNYDGICNNVDLELWENMNSNDRMRHKQWCYQVEKKAKVAISGAKTYNQLWKGFNYIENRPPTIIIYR